MIKISKFERHMAKPVAIELENEDGQKDEFLIKPLPFKFTPELFKLMKMLSKLDLKQDASASEEEQTKRGLDFLQKMPDESFELMVELIKETLKISYPEVSDEQRDKLASAHMMELLNGVLEANSHGGKFKGQDK